MKALSATTLEDKILPYLYTNPKAKQSKINTLKSSSYFPHPTSSYGGPNYSMDQESTAVPKPIDVSTTYWRKGIEKMAVPLEKMLDAAQYPSKVKQKLLSFFIESICPAFGPTMELEPDDQSPRSGITADGSPIEYSFNFEPAKDQPDVRFSVDLTPFSSFSGDFAALMSTKFSERIINEIGSRNTLDTTWHDSLHQFFQLSLDATTISETAHDLVTSTLQPSRMWLAFDIQRSPTDSDTLLSEYIPASVKTYFLPCLSAAERGVTRWEAVSAAIRQLPGLDQSPGISTSLQLIEDFLASKPPECQELVRILATDLKHPSKARIKLYLRCPENDFEGVWEWLTLGGRYTKYDEYKGKFKDLYDLVMGTPASSYDSTKLSSDVLSSIAKGSLCATDGKNMLRSKRTTMCYFSLQGNELQPTPKLLLGPKYSALSDLAVAKGVAQWFQSQGWNRPGTSLYETTIQQVL